LQLSHTFTFFADQIPSLHDGRSELRFVKEKSEACLVVVGMATAAVVKFNNVLVSDVITGKIGSSGHKLQTA
jgi:hypothetical protein